MNLPDIVSFIEKASPHSISTCSDSKVIQHPNWYQIITPSVRHSRFNAVTQSQLTPENADERIQSTIKRYSELNLPFRWDVGPSTEPLDLGSRLQKHGMILTSNVYGMVAEPERIRSELPPNIDIEIINPNDTKNFSAAVDEWVKTFVSGWELPLELTPYFKDEILRNLKDRSQKIRYLLARYQGRPAGTAALRLIHDTGYFQGSAIIPELRNQGIYKALVAYRLQILSHEKIPYATVQCLRDTSAPICRNLGFETVCQFQVYEFSPATK